MDIRNEIAAVVAGRQPYRAEVSRLMSDKECGERWRGEFLPEPDAERGPIFKVYGPEEGDIDVFIEGTGDCLLKLRRNVLPQRIIDDAYANLYDAAAPQDNRGVAGGKIDPAKIRPTEEIGEIIGDGLRFLPKKADGTLSKTSRGNLTQGGIVGYFDRTGRFPYCRKTAYTRDHMERLQAATPIIRAVDECYSILRPQEYGLQLNQASETDPHWLIADTAFTTVTVNLNFPTAVHKDAGDFRLGFGNLTVMRRGGEYTGAFTCFPEFGVGVDVRERDVLMMDVHRWHGNTPMSAVNWRKKANRLALVMYYRENMFQCQSPAEEAAIAKREKSKINVTDADEEVPT
jgi:hypothetical protein